MKQHIWKLRINPTSKDDVENWLTNETILPLAIKSTGSAILLEFDKIDDAFRFRMKFDSSIIQ